MHFCASLGKRNHLIADARECGKNSSLSIKGACSFNKKKDGECEQQTKQNEYLYIPDFLQTHHAVILRHNITRLFLMIEIHTKHKSRHIHLHKQGIFWDALLTCTISFMSSIVYLTKINNGNTRKMYVICLTLTIKTPEWRHIRATSLMSFWCLYYHFWTDFALVFPLLTLNMQILTGCRTNKNLIKT